MIRNYLKVAWRTLTRNWTYGAINAFGLAVGLATCLLIGLYVWQELRVDTFYENADRVMVIAAEDEGFFGLVPATPAPLAPLLQERSPYVAQVARTDSEEERGISRPGEELRGDQKVLYADSSLAQVLTFSAVQGDPAAALARPDAAVITESVARRYFGEENPVGQTILVDSEEEPREQTVRAVVEDTPEASTVEFDVIVPMPSEKLEGGWGRLVFTTYVLLDQPRSAETFTEHISTLIEEEIDNSSLTYFATPLPDLYLSELHDAEGFRGQWSYLYIFGSAALLLLLIACINYVNLATARGLRRAREIGVRKTLGATSGQLAGQLLGEALILTTMSALAAVALVAVVLPSFNGLFGTSITLDQVPLALALPALGLLVLLVGVGAGAYPAFVTARFNPARILQGEEGATAPGGGGIHRGLIVFQFAISVALIACTLVIYQQLGYVQSTSLGFEADQLAIAEIPGEDVGRPHSLQQALRDHPGVLSVAFAESVPSEHVLRIGRAAEGLSPEHDVPDPEAIVTFRPAAVDSNYVETMGLRLVAGTSLRDARAQADRPPALLNETGARRLGWTPEEAIGKPFALGEEHTVVGVVADFHIESLREEIDPVVLQLNEEGAWSSSSFVAARLASDHLRSGREHVATTITERTSESSVEVRFLDDTFEAMYRSEARIGTIFLVFAALAIVVACLGLYGLAAHAVQRRRREIGIRKALGASMANILALLSKEFVLLVGIALLIGTPAAYVAMRRWLQDFAYRVELGPMVFLLGATLALFVAGLALATQGWRAARTDPATTLRDE